MTNLLIDINTPLEELPKSREDGIAVSSPLFYDGKPCKHGHVGQRYTTNGSCCDCVRLRAKKKQKGKYSTKPTLTEAEADQITETPLVEKKPFHKRKFNADNIGMPGFVPYTHRILQAKSRPRIHNKEELKRLRETYYFDRHQANRVISFFEKRITHSKGPLFKQPYILSIWEKRILKRLFGWRKISDGTRRYKTLYLEVPRKNSKTTLVAGLGIYLMGYDGEKGADVIAAAASKDQAGEIYNTAMQMVLNNEHLSRDLICWKTSIMQLRSNSVLKRTSSVAGTSHGKNIHAILFDELHAQRDAELYDVLHTATGSRNRSMEILITTAGEDQDSVCYELHNRCEKINNGVLQDDTFLGYIFGADPKDDPFDPKTWFKANPNLGVSKNYDYMVRENLRAKDTPRYFNTHLRLDLNIWTSAYSKWISSYTWEKNGVDITDELLEGRAAFGGLDLASTEDIACFSVVFGPTAKDPRWITIPYFFCPEETIVAKSKGENIYYKEWVDNGSLISTPGSRINYNYVKDLILSKVSQYGIKEIAYDQFQCEQLASDLTDLEIEMFPVSQSIGVMNEPSKEFERLVVEGLLCNDKNRVMRWMVSNCVVETNAKEEIKPTKKKSKTKIDGVIATILSIDRVMRYADSQSGFNNPDNLDRLILVL